MDKIKKDSDGMGSDSAKEGGVVLTLMFVVG